MNENSATHFHIHWTIGDTSRMDWEPFSTRDEAERLAKRIARASESYRIQEFDQFCPRRASSQIHKKGSHCG